MKTITLKHSNDRGSHPTKHWKIEVKDGEKIIFSSEPLSKVQAENKVVKLGMENGVPKNDTTDDAAWKAAGINLKIITPAQGSLGNWPCKCFN